VRIPGQQQLSPDSRDHAPYRFIDSLLTLPVSARRPRLSPETARLQPDPQQFAVHDQVRIQDALVADLPGAVLTICAAPLALLLSPKRKQNNKLQQPLNAMTAETFPGQE
jgi:hypothetical protein